MDRIAFSLVTRRSITVVLFVLLFMTFNIAKAQEGQTRFDGLQFRNTHPRIWIDAEKLQQLKEKCKGKTAQDVETLAGSSVVGLALTYIITGDENFGKQAIQRVLDKPFYPGFGFNDLNSADGENKRIHFQSTLTDRALCCDWCYNLLTYQEKNEPKIGKDRKTFELTDGGGRLVGVPVLPRKLQVSKIGGSGKEFLVDTTRFKCGLKSVIDPQQSHYGEIPGAWRIEESPAEAAKENYFLNVILLTESNSGEIPSVKLLSETEEKMAVQIRLKSGKMATVEFAKGNNPSAFLKLTNSAKVLAAEKMPEEVVIEKEGDN